MLSMQARKDFLYAPFVVFRFDREIVFDFLGPLVLERLETLYQPGYVSCVLLYDDRVADIHTIGIHNRSQVRATPLLLRCISTLVHDPYVVTRDIHAPIDSDQGLGVADESSMSLAMSPR
jgi:hypothetical protein